MEIKIPGIDTEYALDLCDGDVNIYLRILHSYVSDMTANLEKIQTVTAETLKDYAVTIHGIKSISDAVGAQTARNTAKQLEDIAKSGDLDGVIAKNSAFLNYAENLMAGLKFWLETNSN